MYVCVHIQLQMNTNRRKHFGSVKPVVKRKPNPDKVLHKGFSHSKITDFSTVGLGDIIPSSPHILISMFAMVLIGLSLVSMSINLLQARMNKTYSMGSSPRVNEKFTTIGVLQVK